MKQNKKTPTLLKKNIETECSFVNTPINLTQRCPVGDESVSELSPAAVVLQQSDEGGGRAGGPTQLTQLRHTLTVLPENAHQPVSGGHLH